MVSNKKPPAQGRRTVAVRLIADLHRRAKIWAARNDISIQDVFKEALDEYLKKRGA